MLDYWFVYKLGNTYKLNKGIRRIIGDIECKLMRQLSTISWREFLNHSKVEGAICLTPFSIPVVKKFDEHIYVLGKYIFENWSSYFDHHCYTDLTEIFSDFAQWRTSRFQTFFKYIRAYKISIRSECVGTFLQWRFAMLPHTG